MDESKHFDLRDAICPYVCSTPLDFTEERDYLASEIFPQLNQLCKSRGSFFNPSDLRWAPGDQNTEKGFLLTTLLSSIKRCSPYFICLLGETYGPYREQGRPNNTPQEPLTPLPSYIAPLGKLGGGSVKSNGEGLTVSPSNRAKKGQHKGPTHTGLNGISSGKADDVLPAGGQGDWLDRNFRLAGTGGHSWVMHEGHESSSLTELEVTQGVLLCDSQHTTFYYRQSEHMVDKLAYASNQKEKEHLARIFCSESEEARVKIHDLRQRMVNRGVPVRYFRSKEQLGQMVLEDWVEIINMVLPPLLHSVKLLDTLEFKEWQAQQSFIRSRTDIFFSTPEVEDALHKLTDFAFTCHRAEVKGDFLEEIFSTPANNTKIRSYSATAPYKKKPLTNDQQTSIMLVVGDRGVGKSSFIAKWLQDFRSEHPVSVSGIPVIAHFVSSSSNSTDLVSFMRRCIRELRETYLLSESYNSLSIRASVEDESEASDPSFRALCEAFIAALGLGPVVILFDGLNELTSARGLTAREVKEFSWLQDSLPATCKLMLTTTRSDISYRSLVSRQDVTVINFPASLMEPKNTLSMVKEHCPVISQLVGGESRLQKLSQLKIMSTALGAKVVASEVCCHRIYSNLLQFLEDCAEVWSLRDFWILSVKNWIQEHSWSLDLTASENNFLDNGFDYSGWVTDSLCLIAVSRNGLTVDQIRAILEVMGYRGQLRVTSYDWLQFRMSAGASLREKEDGRLVFGHRYLQEIAEYLFFKSMSSVSYDPAMILKLASSEPRQEYHLHLARFFQREPLDTQVMEELPWHLMWSGDIASLLDFLTDCGALLKILSSEGTLWQQDLKLYWSIVQLFGHKPDVIYLQMLQAMGVIDNEGMQLTEDILLLTPGRNDHLAAHSPMEFLRESATTPMIVVSTPQPDKVPNGHLLDDQYDDDDQSDLADQRDMDEVHRFNGVPNKVPVDQEEGLDGGEREGDELAGQVKQEDDEEAGLFLTQVDADNDIVISSGSADKKFDYQDERDTNNFPGVAALTWRVVCFLQALDKKKASKVLVDSLIKYFKRNYPLTLEQQLLLCRCHHTAGSLSESEAVRDLNDAELAYRQALHALVAAEDMDDELEFEEDAKYLKGLLLSCHGSLRVQADELYEAEELLKEALECIEGDPNCFVLKSAIFANLGHLRYAQGDFPRAESCLREATKLRCRWFGRCHPLVADVLVSLAKLLAAPSNEKGQDPIQAEHLFRQSLTISEKCFGASSLSVAGVLCHLGELLAQEESHPAKMEAQKLFRRSLDIRTSELGTNHPITQGTQQHLTKLDVALQLGHYEFGSAKHTGRRPNNLPFSTLTFREDDLSRLQSRVGSVRVSPGEYGEAPISVRTISREEVMRHNRPDSMLSYGGAGGVSLASLVSASERLLTAPTGHKPERLLSKRARDERQELGSTQRSSGQGQGGFGRTSSENRGGVVSSTTDLVMVDSLDSKGRRHVVGDVGGKESASTSQNLSEENKAHGLPETNGEDSQLTLNNANNNEKQQAITVNLNHGVNIETLPEETQFDDGHLDAEVSSKQIGEGDKEIETLEHSVAVVPTQKKTVVIRPASGPRRMFEKYGTHRGGDEHVDSEIEPYSPRYSNGYSRQELHSAKASGRTTSSSFKVPTSAGGNVRSSKSCSRVWSGRSEGASSSATSGHMSRCHVPGPHDLNTSARTIGGPHSSLSSLLGEPVCPRPASRPKELHHRAAWYHVPGRYRTPHERYPRKRMQKTENARDIEAFVSLKTQWAKRRQMELQRERLRELQLQEQEEEERDLPQDPHTVSDTSLYYARNHKRGNKRHAIAANATTHHTKPFSQRKVFSSDPRSRMAPTRRLMAPQPTPRLMISGLDMVPEKRYTSATSTYMPPPEPVHAVKFREPIIVG